MSKSLGNHILMSDEPERIQEVVTSAITDPQKIRKDDPGRPEICNVYAWHCIFNRAEEPTVATECRAGTRGCVACKKEAAGAIADHFADFRAERKRLEGARDHITAVLRAGTERARAVATRTMARVREVMGLFSLGE
jgi:tryptophanyl-tRNA synthetase